MNKVAGGGGSLWGTCRENGHLSGRVGGAWHDRDTGTSLKRTEQDGVTNAVTEIGKGPVMDLGFYSRRKGRRRNYRGFSSRVTQSNLTFQRLYLESIESKLEEDEDGTKETMTGGEHCRRQMMVAKPREGAVQVLRCSQILDVF